MLFERTIREVGCYYSELVRRPAVFNLYVILWNTDFSIVKTIAAGI